VSYGTEYSDTIVDLASKDHIDALGGNDLIILANEHNFEYIIGGLGSDTVSLVNLYGTLVDLGDGNLGSAYVQNTLDVLDSIENVIGSSGGDTILGSAGVNELFGMGGDDVFEGKSGADKIDGGSGFDTASYVNSNTGVTVHLDNGFGYGGHAQGDRLFSIERVIGSTKGDFLSGNAGRNVLEAGDGNDLLEGNDGNDVLMGGAGEDWIVGGRGADRLTGGGAADTFAFQDRADSYFLLGHTDSITDFNHSVGDQIDLSSIDAKPGQAGNQAFTYIGANAFTAVGQVRAHTDGNGNMVVEVNATKGSAAEMTIIVEDIVTLVGDDFIL
jgi:Ca2+-binding RTX toxin-like protein